MTCQICLIIKLKHDPILATSSISIHLLTVLESRECKKLSLFKRRAWVVSDHFLRVGSISDCLYNNRGWPEEDA